MKVNTTFEIEPERLTGFEQSLRDAVKVYDFKIVPDNTELYQTDPHFKRLSKAVKDAQRNRDRYANDHRK
jgi:hypothetical protein